MTINPYSPPTANLETIATSDGAPALWSPGVTAVLSFFLSPVFGGIINMKNWQAMGEPDRARESKIWAIGTVVFYALLIAAEVWLPETTAKSWLSRLAGLAFFITWYMMSCTEQKEVIMYRYGTAFPKRGWTIPVLAAFGAYIGFVVAGIASIVGFMAATGQS